MSEAEKIAEQVVEQLEKNRSIDAETHKNHHEMFPRVLAYIDAEIKEKEDKLIFWNGVRKQVFGWGIIVLLSGIGVAVADYAKHFFKG